MSINEDRSVFDNIIYFLNEDGCEYELLEHAFVHSSEDAAKIRGTNLEEAAKALVLVAKYATTSAATRTNVDKVNLVGAGKEGCAPFGVPCSGRVFFMCVVSGNKRLDLKKIKSMLGCKNVSLASPEDVKKVTGLEVGKVPPFPFLFDLEGYVDQGVLDNEFVVFSAGSHYKSIRMLSENWKELAEVEVKDIA